MAKFEEGDYVKNIKYENCYGRILGLGTYYAIVRYFSNEKTQSQLVTWAQTNMLKIDDEKEVFILKLKYGQI
jgi:hypothetical protein